MTAHVLFSSLGTHTAIELRRIKSRLRQLRTVDAIMADGCRSVQCWIVGPSLAGENDLRHTRAAPRREAAHGVDAAKPAIRE
ncbi:MAG: hypothetical protein D6725_03245 [Planctomycetota bacterium]|nr:MAG: hypothetical protein D6725_03245 [Planctomycetota bacterium]